MSSLPTGTVTFLFSDIEASTRLLNELGPERYAEALAEHRRLLRQAFARHGGVEVDTQGDSFFVAFPTAPGAVAAAAEAQAAVAAAGVIRVRMGLHTGTPLLTEEGYVGADVHRAARIAAAAHGGQVVLSRGTRELLEAEVRVRDLGEHRLRDLSAPERLFQLSGDEFPPLKSLHATNLPVPSTSFLGREIELAEVVELLSREDVSLLTLTGAGGTGKTRLALQAAGLASGAYPEGVWWVPLSSLRDSTLVLEAARHATGARLELREHIGARAMLLLFDNFEHVSEAAGEVATLLAACPNLNVLVTSRQPLHVSAEHQYPVPPLAHNDAVALFNARATAVDPAFAPDGAVSEICRRLDELPLAVELAAARVKALPPPAILKRLEHRLPLLTGGVKDAPARQRTLRATIQWSHDLLNHDEQRLFARLAVFAGGCTSEAAEQVADADLDTLQSLVDKSLIRHIGGRYWMLETIREYALARLDAAGETQRFKRRHAAWYMRYVRRHLLETQQQVGGATPPEQELDNIRATLRLLLTSGHVEPALRITTALAPLWISRGYLREGRELLAEGLASGNVAPRVRARALLAAGWITAHEGEHESARTMLEQSLRISRDSNDNALVASALHRLGMLLTSVGEYDHARRTLDQAFAAYTEAGDTTGRSTLANALAILAGFEGDLEAARRWLEEDRRHRADIGDRRGYGDVSANLGLTAVLQGDYEAAEPLLEQALAIANEFGDSFEIANILASRGRLDTERGNLEHARQDFVVALETYAEAGAQTWCAECLEGLGRIAVAKNEPEKAARLLAAASSTRERTRARLAPAEQQAFDEAVASLEDGLDASALATAWQLGQDETLEESIRYALGL